MNDNISEILGLLCSDGTYRKYTSTYIVYDKRRPNPYRTTQTKRIAEFTNTNFKLLKHFQNLIFKEFNYMPSLSHSNHNVFRVSIAKNNVLDELLKYVRLGEDKWFVPKEILNGNKFYKSAFLRGFFDGDGSVDFANKGITPRIRISSTNFNGITQLYKLLKSLKLDCKIWGPYKRVKKKNAYEIVLKTSSIPEFIELIGSNHSKKMERFKNILQKHAQCRDGPIR